MRVLWPPKDGEGGHRQEHDNETPVVDGTSSRMTTRTFWRHHGDDPCERAHKSCSHMQRHNTEEQWRRRRDRDAENDDTFVGHRVSVPVKGVSRCGKSSASL